MGVIFMVVGGKAHPFGFLLKGLKPPPNLPLEKRGGVEITPYWIGASS